MASEDTKHLQSISQEGKQGQTISPGLDIPTIKDSGKCHLYSWIPVKFEALKPTECWPWHTVPSLIRPKLQETLKNILDFLSCMLESRGGNDIRCCRRPDVESWSIEAALSAAQLCTSVNLPKWQRMVPDGNGEARIAHTDIFQAAWAKMLSLRKRLVLF